MSSGVITPGPYRATKLWNEVTRLFRAGMPLRKHRQNLRHHASCFTAAAAVDWLHQLLRGNSNFGPDVSRQQTVQLLKKFLKNHVIEDVKGRWGSEELEDNNALYRFPSTSPLKPLPQPAPPAPKAVKKRPSLRDKDGLFRFRGTKRADKDVQENLDGVPPEEGAAPQLSAPPRRELTVEDEQEVWRDITLTHLQRILGVSSLEDVLDHRHVNAQNIIHNMTKVNKHGVVTLDDKNGDLPHWVLSAMKSLANWPKYDSSQPSYPGFERDVFRTVSDYFLSLPQPLLTYQLYELFINVLVYCGYVTAPSSTQQRGKRKQAEGPRGPPAKTSFRSTECLLLSLLRRGSCDEAESPMREVLGGRPEWRLAAAPRGGGGAGAFGGSCSSLSTLGTERPPTRSCSLETVLDDSAPLTRQQLFRSTESLASCTHSNHGLDRDHPGVTAGGGRRRLRPRSVGSRLDAVAEEDGREARCGPAAAAAAAWRPPAFIPLSTAVASHSSSSSSLCAAAPPRRGVLHGAASSSAHALRTAVRRCHSAMDVSALPPPPVRTQPPQPEPEHSLLQPQCERMAIEALQVCTLLLPPVSRRKLQLLMRMMARISQNVDMPRLHAAIATRTLMVHTFSSCILGSAGECDLDELLATRLVSFLLDHQQNILSVPDYLLSAINDHVSYLRTVQVPVDSTSDCGGGQPGAPIPMYAFCRQISGAEFEQQKLAASQKAMEELLEMLLTDQNLSEKDRRRKLKQFQKQYPDIYRRRLPATDGGGSADNKPKIKAPLLSIKKSKAFSIRT